jgi:hypothetical protein
VTHVGHLRAADGLRAFHQMALGRHGEAGFVLVYLGQNELHVAPVPEPDQLPMRLHQMLALQG